MPDNLGELEAMMFGGDAVTLPDGTTMHIDSKILLLTEFDSFSFAMDNGDQGKIASFLYSFKGRLNQSEESQSVTVVIPFQMAMAILRTLRKQVANTPAHLRKED